MSTKKHDFFDINSLIEKTKTTFGRIISIDFGTRKIGIAVSDANKQQGFPKEILFGNWNNAEKPANSILSWIKKNEVKVSGIIIGYPISNSGEKTKNCIIVEQIAETLKQAGFEVLLFDERFTTKSISSLNNSIGIKNQFNAKDDANSAMIMLNEILEMMNNN